MDKERNKIIAENIRGFIKSKNITQKQLANDIGISPSTLSDYLNLRSNPSHGVIQRIADYFGVGKSDIDTTFKDIPKSSLSSKVVKIMESLSRYRQHNVYYYAENQLNEQNGKTEPIFLVGETAAGYAIEYSQMNAEQINTTIPKGADYALTVRGDSMEPLIKDGSIIFYKEQPVVENGEIAIIEIGGGEVTCKKFYFNGEKVILRSINDKYEDMIFDNGVRVIGKVIL